MGINVECRLRNGDCRVYIFDGLEQIDDRQLSWALGQVSPARRAKAEQYLYRADRVQCVMAELLLIGALRDAGLEDECRDIVIGAGGKPSFVNPRLPYFSLSHCSHAVACAVADTPIGVDVEGYDAYSDEVARLTMNAGELNEIEGDPARFAELWTRKESLLKYTGEGLQCEDLPGLLDTVPQGVSIASYHSPKGYVCSVTRKVR